MGSGRWGEDDGFGGWRSGRWGEDDSFGGRRSGSWGEDDSFGGWRSGSWGGDDGFGGWGSGGCCGEGDGVGWVAATVAMRQSAREMAGRTAAVAVATAVHAGWHDHGGEGSAGHRTLGPARPVSGRTLQALLALPGWARAESPGSSLQSGHAGHVLG